MNLVKIVNLLRKKKKIKMVVILTSNDGNQIVIFIILPLDKTDLEFGNQ